MKMRLYSLLVCFVLSFCISCNGDRRPNPSSVSHGPPPEKVVPAELPSKATVKIYFENTLSMDGYINGHTGFKDVFRDLLVAVDNEDAIDLSTEFYLLNNKLTPTDFGVEVTKISEELTPASTSNKGNKGSSNFEEILNTVIQNQEGDVISVIMADFIYSPEGKGDTRTALNKLRAYTQDVFLKATNENKDIETRIYSFTSDFNGTYFDINNKHIQGITNRPYYYFVLAPSNLMPVFANQIAPHLKRAEGYGDEALFTTAKLPSIPTKILTATGNNGRIKARDLDIEVMSYPKNGSLEFAVLLDFTDLPIDNNFISDENNYQLTNPEFSIKNIGLVEGKYIDFRQQDLVKINSSDLVSIKDENYTHAILFTCEGLVSEDLQFALKKEIPAWIEKVNSNDDQQIRNDPLEQTKTFGFGHLVEGISRAYEQQSGNAEYFNITIPVK